MSKKKHEWIEIALRWALIYSALFLTFSAILSKGARFFSLNEEWLSLAIYIASALLALRLARNTFLLKNRKAKIWISSLGLTYVAILIFIQSFYGNLFLF